MDANLRRAWTEVVTPEDYDLHMANNGQAQANAQILEETVRNWGLPKDASLLIVGAGTAHFLDFVDSSFLHDLSLTMSDLNSAFLEVAKNRLVFAGLTSTTLIVDDIESTSITQSFDAVIVVLVLEHIDWTKGLLQIAKLCADRLLIVIQQNADKAQSVLTTVNTVPASIQVFASEAVPKLVEATELEKELDRLGFETVTKLSRSVASGKQMVGLSCTHRGG